MDDDELRLEHVWFGWSRWTETIILAACAFFAAWHCATSHLAVKLWLAPFAVAAGVYAAYWSLAVLRNRSTFVMRRGRLTVRHGPLPMPFQRELDGEEVRQLYLAVRRTPRRHSARYDLRVLTAGGDDVTLLDNVRSRSEAARLERAIERHLGIADDPSFGT